MFSLLARLAGLDSSVYRIIEVEKRNNSLWMRYTLAWMLRSIAPIIIVVEWVGADDARAVVPHGTYWIIWILRHVSFDKPDLARCGSRRIRNCTVFLIRRDDKKRTWKTKAEKFEPEQKHSFHPFAKRKFDFWSIESERKSIFDIMAQRQSQSFALWIFYTSLVRSHCCSRANYDWHTMNYISRFPEISILPNANVRFGRKIIIEFVCNHEKAPFARIAIEMLFLHAPRLGSFQNWIWLRTFLCSSIHVAATQIREGTSAQARRRISWNKCWFCSFHRVGRRATETRTDDTLTAQCVLKTYSFAESTYLPQSRSASTKFCF